MFIGSIFDRQNIQNRDKWIIQRAEKRRKRKEKLEKAKKDAQDSNSENDENDPSTNWLKAGARRKRTVSYNHFNHLFRLNFFQNWNSALFIPSTDGIRSRVLSSSIFKCWSSNTIGKDDIADGKTSEDLVSESTNEMEKRKEGSRGWPWRQNNWRPW